MTLIPQVLGLVLCDRFAVDPQTRQVALVGLFHVLRFATFPAHSQAFVVYAAVCDAVGEGIMRLEVTRLDTQQVTYFQEKWSAFPADRLLVLSLEIPVRKCVFPIPGRYTVRLLFDGALAAERALVVEMK